MLITFFFFLFLYIFFAAVEWRRAWKLGGGILARPYIYSWFSRASRMCALCSVRLHPPRPFRAFLARFCVLLRGVLLVVFFCLFDWFYKFYYGQLPWLCLGQMADDVPTMHSTQRPHPPASCLWLHLLLLAMIIIIIIIAILVIVCS